MNELLLWCFSLKMIPKRDAILPFMPRYGAVLLAACALFAVALAPGAAGGQVTTSGSALVVVIPGSKQFHQPGCPLVRKAGSQVKVMKQAEAERRGFTPHDCGDPGNPQRDAAAATNASTVYVQANDKQYHASGCKRLKPGAAAITVEKAAQDHWPCPVCKPPIRQHAK
jgi:hypothetical protein